jgi:hypothetical protein
MLCWRMGGRDCRDARRRRLLLARREHAGLLAAKAERCAEAVRRDDGWPGVARPTGWREGRGEEGLICAHEKTDRGGGTRASGPAQPSPGHGERAARRAVERGKGGRAHLGETQRGAAQRVRQPARQRRRSGRGVAPTAATTRRRATNWARGAGFRPILGRRGRLLLWKFAWSVWEEAQWRPGTWAQLTAAAAGARRSTRGRARRARWRWRWATGLPWARGAELGRGGRALGQHGASVERRRVARSWAVGAHAGPRKGKGRWAERGGGGGKRRRRGWGGPVEWAREGGKTDFLSLFFLFFSIISV